MGALPCWNTRSVFCGSADNISKTLGIHRNNPPLVVLSFTTIETDRPRFQVYLIPLLPGNFAEAHAGVEGQRDRTAQSPCRRCKNEILRRQEPSVGRSALKT